MDKQITQLVEELEALPVNHNSFYRRFKETQLTKEQLIRFAGQYFWFCNHFIKVLIGLIYNTPTSEASMRLELIKTLYSEMGYGKEEAIHLNLLRRFTSALGMTGEELQAIEPIREVKGYIEGLDELFTRSDYRVSVGAEFGVEITAAPEFTYLYPGVQQYEAFSSQDIYFFAFHLREEELHGDWLTEAVRKICKNEEDFELIKTGASQAADLWAEFWEGMERYVFAS